jgi:hypothetical protein
MILKPIKQMNSYNETISSTHHCAFEPMRCCVSRTRVYVYVCVCARGGDTNLQPAVLICTEPCCGYYSKGQK